jgi:O-antigen ligase
MLVDRLAKYTLFLFPIFVVSIRHWASGFFGLLVLLGLVNLFRSRENIRPLLREEKTLIVILIAYFGIFLISSVVNGWGKAGTYGLGTEIRYVLIIPVYLMLRNISGAERYLLAGSILAAVVGGVQGLLDVFIFDRPLAWGFYGHLFIGPATLLMVGLLIPAIRILKINKRYWPVLAALVLLGLTTVALSTARSAYLGFIVLGFVSVIYYFRGRTTLVVIAVLAGLVLSTYMISDKVQYRIHKGVSEVTAYFDTLEKYPDEPEKYAMGSLGTRLEMWRSTQYFFDEAPWFGIGRFNYQEKAQEYVDQGLANQAIADHSHPHNVFIGMLITKGLFGLILLLLLLYYPLYVFIGTRKISPDSAFAGIVLITCISVFSLTTTDTFIKGNFVAINLIYLSVFFSWHLREIYREKKSAVPQ